MIDLVLTRKLCIDLALDSQYGPFKGKITPAGAASQANDRAQ